MRGRQELCKTRANSQFAFPSNPSLLPETLTKERKALPAQAKNP